MQDEEKKEEIIFTEWLKDLRINNGFSQPKMAEALGLSPASIYNIETGKTKPTPKVMLKISNRFGIPIKEIREMKGVK